MKARVCCTVLFTFLIFNVLVAQKVGLVMSGGGAKGFTHIGVIKALEENNIPIDYVAGTSMGAIIGGLYAMGYSPDEMIELFKSEDFKRWSTGEIATKQKYFFRNPDPKPSFIDLYVDIKNPELLKKKSKILPINLISPRQMNYAFMELFSQATAASRGDFNRLFVPFRCVAADVYEKQAVVLRKGDLGDAVRASMTFPLVYKPIEINNKLLFDGGIFNNFPVDVMEKDFHPNFMVGSVVANDRQKPDPEDVASHLRNMIMSPTCYDLDKNKGQLIRFDLSEVGEFDFDRLEELVKIGYEQTLTKIDSIRREVKNKISKDSLALRRQKYQSSLPRFRFNKVEVSGVDKFQQEYIRRIFHDEANVFGLTELQNGYFRLVNDEKISEVKPRAVYNDSTGFFALHLAVKVHRKLKLQLGGNVSSSTSNQAYLGISYQKLTNYSHTSYLDVHFGRIYNSLGAGIRIDAPWETSSYLKWVNVFHRFNYFKSGSFLLSENTAALYTQNELYTKLSVGMPLTYRNRLELGAGLGILKDKYFNQDDIYQEEPLEIEYDIKQTRSVYRVASFFGRLETYSLNNVMYPTEGYKAHVVIQFNISDEGTAHKNEKIEWDKAKKANWFQGGFSVESYKPLAKHFTLGYLAEGKISNRPLSQSYTASVMQMPAFAPTPHSQTALEPLYRSHTYVAAGIKPMVILSKQWHLRTECYLFAPYRTIQFTDTGISYNKEITPFSQAQWLGECSLVYNFKLATVSAFANYYSGGISPYNFGVNLGFLLFNKRFLE